MNENKVIPGLIESNEILKNDLAQVRRRHKEDRLSAQKQIQLMESQARDVDSVKNDVRALALRLLDISSNNNPNNPNNNNVQVRVGGDSVNSTSMQSLMQQQQQMTPDNYRRYQQQQQQQQQVLQ